MVYEKEGEKRQMIFKCQNCGGNVVYSPDKEAMYCPHCEGIESQQKMEGNSEEVCVNCGATLMKGEFTSASKCEYCGNYIIFDEKVEGMYKPNLILPFKIGKEKAKEILKTEFKKKAFTPASFLSDATLDKMEGVYVPFWLYDYLANYSFSGEGTRVRTWRSGNKEYTETSFYHIERELDIDFDKIPVDASNAMDDKIMDLMEPYDYKVLEEFQEKYMSGFLSEVFNEPSGKLEPRAKAKAQNDSEALLNETLSGYHSVRPHHKNLQLNKNGLYYALFPVWVYTYSYKNEKFPFYINGQTGKVIGKTPMSAQKLTGYAATVFGCTFLIMTLLKMIMGVI